VAFAFIRNPREAPAPQPQVPQLLHCGLDAPASQQCKLQPATVEAQPSAASGGT
jgi:hypothetical protein